MSILLAVLQSTLAYLANQRICQLLGWLRPKPPGKPDYSGIYTSPQYSVETAGKCAEGSYIEVYRPATPYLGDNGRPKAVIYLHGFALGASQIYRVHLEHLVRQGYTVFYPNYQTGFCQFPDGPFKTVAALIAEIFGDGLIPSQEKWLENALESVSAAYARVGFGEGVAVDTYVYGHSLGGLFALSWPYYVKNNGKVYPDNLLPLQVLAADPIASTGGAQLPGKLGKKLKAMSHAIDIDKVGKALTMPVAILHGNDDWIVPSEQWQEPFTAIATPHKRMFLSKSDGHGCPGLYANHEQATDDTSFFPERLALLVLGGVGVEDNLDWRYIWFALERVIRDGVRRPARVRHGQLVQWATGDPGLCLSRRW